MIKFITVSVLKAALEVERSAWTNSMLLIFFVPPATPLPAAALEMNTQHAGVTLIRLAAKLQLLKFDARCLYFERALYFAKLDLVSTEVFVRILAHFVKLYASSVLVNSLRDGLWGRV